MRNRDREQIENATLGFLLSQNEATLRAAARSEADASVLAYELAELLLRTFPQRPAALPQKVESFESIVVEWIETKLRR